MQPFPSSPPASRRPLRTRLVRAALTVLAVGYPATLLAMVLAFRFFGERWWVTLVALYLPRWGFALPGPVLVLALLLWGPRKLVLLQVASGALLLFPLMGLELHRHAALADGPLRVASFNIHLGLEGADNVIAQLEALSPNVIVLQEARLGPRTRAIEEHYATQPGWNLHTWDQFMLASRFPILSVYTPPKLDVGPHQRVARFVGYTLDTPIGPVEVINVHPISPRDGLDELRGEGFRNDLMNGRVPEGARAHIEPNSVLRRRQIEAVSAHVRQSAIPVIVAGDTNLPGLSWLLHEQLLSIGLRDGFAQVGRGFGYTFPVKHPWMRIDRVLTSNHLRVVDFQIGDKAASDHKCVMAVITTATP